MLIKPLAIRRIEPKQNANIPPKSIIASYLIVLTIAVKNTMKLTGHKVKKRANKRPDESIENARFYAKMTTFIPKTYTK